MALLTWHPFPNSKVAFKPIDSIQFQQTMVLREEEGTLLSHDQPEHHPLEPTDLQLLLIKCNDAYKTLMLFLNYKKYNSRRHVTWEWHNVNTYSGTWAWHDVNTYSGESMNTAYLGKELDRSSYWTCFSEVVKPFKWQFSVPWGTESVMRPGHSETQENVIKLLLTNVTFRQMLFDYRIISRPCMED